MATLRFALKFKRCKPLVRPGGLAVAHNINAGMADPRYIKAITTNSVLETVFIHVNGPGISVSMLSARTSLIGPSPAKHKRHTANDRTPGLFN